MKDPVQIELRPLGRTIEVERGTALRDVLYAHGVEFPCGGRGHCGCCRVQVLEGALPVTAEEAAILGADEQAQGWRLACRSRAVEPVALQVEQFAAPVLADHSSFEFEPRSGLGVAVDVGTTTLVAQLIDLQSGRVLAVETALNPQAAYGSDIMHRAHGALEEQQRIKLTTLVRDAIDAMVQRALTAAGPGDKPVDAVVLVGNSVMHHLFSGLPLVSLARFPFESDNDGMQIFSSRELGWGLPADTLVQFLPCLGSFVGSDLLVGVLATGMHESDELSILVDLGTNGEIVLGNRERMLCASTAAGPAFEAGGISMGMQATTGAIDRVANTGTRLDCGVIGNRKAAGVCGSGLVDAVAAGLELGWIEPSGRLAGGRKTLELSGAVHLTQGDIRQLQLAKGAIAAGLDILLKHWGATPDAVAHVHLAGAFGNYIDSNSARRIGMIEFPHSEVEPAGNTALLGAKLALFQREAKAREFRQLRARIEHVALAVAPGFQDTFINETRFPA